jgi:hypothetical protein
MGALSDNRNTPELSTGKQHPVEFTAINADILYAGSILAIDYTGEIQPAADTLGLRVIGRAPKKVDNTADGEKSNADHGIFRYANSSTSPVTRSMIGLPCYVEDDQTVAGKTTNFVPAGLVYDVDSSGVWVDQSVVALSEALKQVPPSIIAKTDDYTVTAAQAFSRRCVFTVEKSSLATITLPSAVGGMLVGVKRLNAGAGYDVAVQAAAGDKVLGSAAGKKIDNTVDAKSSILWLAAADATDWIMAWAPADSENWAVNNG